MNGIYTVSKVITKNQNTYFNNAVIVQTILWKELFFGNFFWDYFHFFYSHTSIFGSNQCTLNEFTYVIYQAWIQITFSLYSQRVNLPSLRLLKERHRFWKQFSERHTKMFALIKLHWKKCLTSWDEYLEGNRTHLIYSWVFDKKSIPFLIFTLYSWKELKCFWLSKERGIGIVCSLLPLF